MVAAISTRDGSHDSFTVPADDLNGLTFDKFGTKLFTADSVIPCRILSAAVGESGLPLENAEWKTVRQFSITREFNISSVRLGRQTFAADGSCLYFFDRLTSRVWGIDPLSLSSPFAATLIAGSAEEDVSSDGDGLSWPFNLLTEIVATPDGCNIFAVVSINGRLRWVKLDSPCSLARSVETVARVNSTRMRGLVLHEYGGALLLFVGATDGSLFELQLNTSELHACSSTAPPPSSIAPADRQDSFSPSSPATVPNLTSLSVSPAIAPDLTSLSLSPPPPPPPPTAYASNSTDDLLRENHSPSSSLSRNLGLLLGLPLSCVAIVGTLVCVAYFASKARRQVVLSGRSKSLASNTGTSTTMTTNGGTSGGGGAPPRGGGEGPQPFAVRQFSLAVLSHCTDGFSHSYRIGDSGAFGAVYWGSIGEDEQEQVAIKLMSGELTPAKRSMFAAEVNTLSRLHHANLIRLIGYCDELGRCILVYPYFPGGSLHARLHKRDKAVPGKPLVPPLTLIERMLIALQIARGLSYLHDGADPPIIHRDIKSSNVLLGDGGGKKLTVVVADFGLATIGERVFGTDYESVVMSSHMAGTFGYMAPEYMQSGILSEKTDVYAFGVIVLELLTGRKAVSPAPSGVGWITLAEWAMTLLVNRHVGGGGIIISDLLEPLLIDEMVGVAMEHMVMETLRLAGECLGENYESRPTMSGLAGSIDSLLKGANIGWLDKR